VGEKNDMHTSIETRFYHFEFRKHSVRAHMEKCTKLLA